jgi:hypothetical protein
VQALTYHLCSIFSDGDLMANKSATDERLGWHEKIAYVAISVAGALFITLFSFVFLVLPRTQDVNNSVTQGMQPFNEKISNINERLATISANIELLKPTAKNKLPQLIRQNLTAHKDSELGLKTVTALASQAQEQKVDADPKQIGEAGNVLTSMQSLFTQKGNSDAWNALSGLLSYYSTLTSIPLPPGKPVSVSDVDYDFGGTNGKVLYGRIGFGGGLVPIDQAAIGEHIVNPKRNPNVKEGPHTVMFMGLSQDETFILDQHHLKNMVLVNVTIEYHGGPVILENVYFINCIFRLSQQLNCVSFSHSLFASNPVTFSNSEQG